MDKYHKILETIGDLLIELQNRLLDLREGELRHLQMLILRCQDKIELLN